MDEWKFPIAYLNHKFPGFIGLTYDQFIAVSKRNLTLAINLGIPYDDYMSLIYKDYKSK